MRLDQEKRRRGGSAIGSYASSYRFICPKISPDFTTWNLPRNFRLVGSPGRNNRGTKVAKTRLLSFTGTFTVSNRLMSAIGDTLEFIRDYLFPPSIDVRPVRPGLSRLDRVSTQFVSEDGRGRGGTGYDRSRHRFSAKLPGRRGLFAGS